MIPTLYKCFQHWSEKGSVYLISDTHFDDPDREFMGYKISEKEQIYLLNETIRKNDTLIHLGDIGNPEYLKSLEAYHNIYKILIMGNHDNGSVKKYFNEVYDGPLCISQKLILSHEPVFLNLRESGEIVMFNIHGHNHNISDETDEFHLNLSQNIFGYFPLNLKNFIESGILKEINSIHRATINYQKNRGKYE